MPGAVSRVSGASGAPSSGVPNPTTFPDAQGRGRDLFIIGVDTIGDETKYIGNDPIDPNE